MNIKKSFVSILFLAFFLALIGCGQQEMPGARVTLKMEEISFFVSEPIKYAERTYGDRMLIRLSVEDGESLTELLRETKNLTVNVYLGDSYYDTVKVIAGEDYSTINLPYRTDAEEIFEKEGIELK